MISESKSNICNSRKKSYWTITENICKYKIPPTLNIRIIGIWIKLLSSVWIYGFSIFRLHFLNDLNWNKRNDPLVLILKFQITLKFKNNFFVPTYKVNIKMQHRKNNSFKFLINKGEKLYTVCSIKIVPYGHFCNIAIGKTL